MRKYIVNSTYCIYLVEIHELYFDSTVVTIQLVAKEVEYECGVRIEIQSVQVKKTPL